MFFSKKTFTPLLVSILLALPTTLAIPAAGAQSSKTTQAATSTQHAQVSIGSVYTPGMDGGAAVTAAPKPASPADIIPGPEFVTITVMNHHTVPVFTFHVKESGAATEVGGQPTVGGAMTRYATSQFAVVEDKPENKIMGDESIIEANYKIPDKGGYTIAVADIDVSYV